MTGMLILSILGIISLAMGLILITGKDNLKKIENLLNKTMITSEGLGYKYSKLLGVILIVLACVLFFIDWSMKK
jgi:hypothetical protein